MFILTIQMFHVHVQVILTMEERAMEERGMEERAMEERAMEERAMEERGIRSTEMLIKEAAEGASGWSSYATFPSEPPWATGNESQQDWTNNWLTNKRTNWCKNTGSGEPLIPAGTAGIPPSAPRRHNPVHQLQLNRSTAIIWARRLQDHPVYVFIMSASCQRTVLNTVTWSGYECWSYFRLVVVVIQSWRFIGSSSNQKPWQPGGHAQFHSFLQVWCFNRSRFLTLECKLIFPRLCSNSVQLTSSLKETEIKDLKVTQVLRAASTVPCFLAHLWFKHSSVWNKQKGTFLYFTGNKPIA